MRMDCKASKNQGRMKRPFWVTFCDLDLFLGQGSFIAENRDRHALLAQTVWKKTRGKAEIEDELQKLAAVLLFLMN